MRIKVLCDVCKEGPMIKHELAKQKEKIKIALEAKKLHAKALLETGKYGKGQDNDEIIDLFDEVLK